MYTLIWDEVCMVEPKSPNHIAVSPIVIQRIAVCPWFLALINPQKLR